MKSASNLWVGLLTVLLVGCCGCFPLLPEINPSGPPPSPEERRRMAKEFEEAKKPHIAVSYYTPTFGTDATGEEVAYVLKQVTWSVNLKDESHWFLCSIRPDGSARREIRSIENRYDGRYLPWLPTGYVEINPGADLGVFGSGEYMLVFSLSGTNIRYFDCLGWKEEGRPWRFSDPTLSPDGQWIAFVEQRCPKGPGGACYFRVVKCRLDGTEYKVLTKFDGYRNDVHPAWSPDGDSIAYVHPRGYSDNDELRVMDVDGNIKWTLSDRFGFDYPCWSPDGKFILLSGRVLVDVASKKVVARLDPPLSRWAKWGKSGYISLERDRVDFVELDGKTVHRLVQNVSRPAKRNDINKDEFRW